MMKQLRSILFLLPALTFLSFSAFAQDTASAEADTASSDEPESGKITAAKGEKLYQEHDCNTCHKINEDLVGPALAGVNERRPEAWLIKWIQHSQKLVEAGDDYAVEIFNEYNQTIMPPANVTPDEVRSILAYIKSETKKAQEAQASAGGGGSSGPDNIYSEGSIMNDGTFKTLAALTILLLLVLFVISFNVLIKFLKFNNKLPDVNWFKVNAYLLGLFLIGGAIGLVYEFNIHTQYLLPEAASKHGATIDQLFLITLIITGFVFIVTQVLLFFFSFKYTGGKKKALYYPVNDKLEVFWTTIPAIALAILVILGFISWSNINSAPKDDAQVIEVFAYQFNWKFRYPGEDGKLGESDFTRIDPGKNPLGLNPEDPNAQDDIITSDLHLPLDKQVVFKIRSRDVIHSAYLPHFRVQMYAQPGMNNTFKFTPTISSEEMKEKVDNEDFQYEMACNQICGAAHYNMKANVWVEKPDSMRSWLSEKETFQQQLEQFAKK